MVKSHRFVRGDVWLVALDPTIGSEIQKTRPALIISPQDLLDHLRTVIVAPMTTGSRLTPFRISCRFRGKSGLVLLDQIRALDKQRFRARLGTIADTSLSQTLTAMRDMFEE